MAPVIQITRYRAIARRDVPLGVPKGDSDLYPIALLLWLFSVARVALTFAHHQVFDVEATMALLCALGLPVYVLRARLSRDAERK